MDEFEGGGVPTPAPASPSAPSVAPSAATTTASTPSVTPPSAPTATTTSSTGVKSADQADVALGQDDDDDNEFDTPHLREIRELFRQLVVTEKNLGLYPPYSNVVQDSLKRLHDAATKCLQLTGTLRVHLSADSFTYEEEEVYSEPERAKSLSFRIHKDGVRDITICEDVTAEELEGFVTCLKDSRKVDEDEDDFITLFWELDCTNIQLQLADDFINTDDLPPVPEKQAYVPEAQIAKFKIPEEEKERLNAALEQRQADDDDDGGDSAFQISEEETAEIRELVSNESTYFPLFDFVDILLELMARNPDPEGFGRSVKMLRTIIAAVIEDLDFERAAGLISKLSQKAHPGLTEAHVRQLREMIETLTDKQTLTLIETFLSEHDKLPSSHPLFTFMRALPKSTLELFCPLLRYQNHVGQVSEVLVHLGTGATSTLARYLDDPDPLVVQAMIGVMLDTESTDAIKHIAKALKHPDEKVRGQAAMTILDKGDASAAPLFIPLLEESSKQLLTISLQFFGKCSAPEAYDNLENLIKSKNFMLLDQKRQRLCFHALVKSSFSRATEFLHGSVLRWTFTFTQRSVARKSAALFALAQLDDPQSREAVERFASKPKGPLASVARRCLREMDQRAKRKASGAEERPTRTRRPPRKPREKPANSSVASQSTTERQTAQDTGSTPSVETESKEVNHV